MLRNAGMKILKAFVFLNYYLKQFILIIFFPFPKSFQISPHLYLPNFKLFLKNQTKTQYNDNLPLQYQENKIKPFPR